VTASLSDTVPQARTSRVDAVEVVVKAGNRVSQRLGKVSVFGVQRRGAPHRCVGDGLAITTAKNSVQQVMMRTCIVQRVNRLVEVMVQEVVELLTRLGMMVSAAKCSR
jgi:hypothetical protein